MDASKAERTSACHQRARALAQHLSNISYNNNNNGQQQMYHGVSITFKGVSVEVGRGKRKKVILNSIDGYMDRATLTALMGQSGSGKTTLLNVLTMHKKPKGGEVLFDGRSPTRLFLKHGIAYAAQEDSLIVNMTVREVLYYSYDLQHGRYSDKKEARGAIEPIVQQLGLDSCLDTLIGDSLRKGISGGQKKRVSIAVAILGRPGFLVLDEPTSGLDSHTSLEVIKVIQRLCRTGLTVLISIHSPNSSVFGLFDRLLMLLGGGVAYFGEVGMSEHKSYFSHLGFQGAMMCENDAEWLSEIISETTLRGLDEMDTLVNVYMESQLRGENLRCLDEIIKASQGTDSFYSLIDKSEEYYNETIMKRLGLWPAWVIIRHRIIADYREPFFLVPRIGEKIIFAVVILTLYLNVGRNLENIIGLQGAGEVSSQVLSNGLALSTCLFMWGVLPAFGTAAVIPSLFSERALYFREKDSGWYSSTAFLLSRVAEEFLLIGVVSAVMAVAVWFAVGLAGSYWIFWLAYVVTSVSGILLAYMFASISPTADFAIILDAGLNIVLLFFTGFLIRQVDIPDYWHWMVYIDYLHYIWGCLMKNEFQSNGNSILFISMDETVLQYYNFDDSTSAWGYLGYAAIFVVVYFILGVLCLNFLTPKYIKR